jgi:ADP-ribosyl-[dinitrogen reductase] hydrolase
LRLNFEQMDVRERIIGCLTGLAVGDALGTTLEFKKPGTFEPIDDMVGGGRFGLEPGQWTDDTSMALCLADSLIARGAFDPSDQMRRYVKWWREGHRSSRPSVCFDIGNTVRGALERFERTGDPFAGLVDENGAGNGSLMRLAPVPMFYVGSPSEAIVRAADSSWTTHGAAEALDACRYFAALLVGALRGEPKSVLLSDAFDPAGNTWELEPLAPRISAIAGGSYKDKNAQSIRASGYVVHTLEAALWAFHGSSTFREGALLAVNLGEDADTTGAVYGQLAGAFYGAAAIPQGWRERLYDGDAIRALAVQLHERQPALR